MLPLLLVLLAALPDDSAAARPLVSPRPAGVVAVVAPADTEPPRRRPRAVEYSEAYGRRLTLHRWGSYAMVPLFAAQYVLGDRLLGQKADAFAGRRDGPPSASLRRTHRTVAGGIGLLFVANTVTGVWNLVEARRDPDGRALRTVHALTLLAADAGFVATGVMGSRAVDESPREARAHRNVALASMGVAAVGAGMMWVFNRR